MTKELTFAEKSALVKSLFLEVTINGKTEYTNKLQFVGFRDNVKSVLVSNKSLKADAFNNDRIAYRAYCEVVDRCYLAFDAYKSALIDNNAKIMDFQTSAYNSLASVYELLNVGIEPDDQYKTDERMFNLLASFVGKFKYDKEVNCTLWDASKTSATFRKQFERLLAWNIVGGTISTAASKRAERKAKAKAKVSK